MNEHLHRRAEQQVSPEPARAAPPSIAAGPAIRVLVVTDVRLYQEGLAQVLRDREQMRVVGSAGYREDALARVRALAPDIVLLDVAMAGSLELVRAIMELAPGVKIVAFAVTDVDEDIFSCAEAGVAGYVPRGASIDDLVAAIQSTARGELLCSPRIAASLFRRLAALTAEHTSNHDAVHLTSREAMIVRLIDQGLSNKDIARRLCIEVATVKNHVHNILEKLHVSRRGEAAARMRMRGSRETRLIERDELGV